MELRLGFLASHGGSNMTAILEAIARGQLPAIPKVVISNNANAKALQTAKEANLPYYWINEKTEGGLQEVDAAIVRVLKHHAVNLVILNGYMKKIGPQTLEAFNGRILNIHPSLLPKYGGQGMFGIHVHQAVLAAHEQFTGATVHVIDENYDKGQTLGQTQVPVLPQDTPETLAARVMAAEKELYVHILRQIAQEDIQLPH